MANRTSRLNAITRQIERLDGRIERLDARSQQFATYRLIAFVGGAVATFGSLYWESGAITTVVLIIAIVIFGLMVYLHRRVDVMARKFSIWQQIKKAQQARMRLDWEHIPPPAARPTPIDGHPFENDLDITGERSLHHLLDTAVTREGSLRLRDWLLHTQPDFTTTQTRQQRVRELVPLNYFRDKLRLSFEMVSKTRLDGHKLTTWLQQSSDESSLTTILSISGVLAMVNIGLLIASFFGLSIFYFVGSFGLYGLIYFFFLMSLGDFFSETLYLESALKKVRAVVLFLERYPYRDNVHLKNLCAPFLDPAQRPSLHLGEVYRITTAIGLRMNPLLQIILNAVGPWDFYFVRRLHQSRQTLAQHVPVWLEAWYELEACASLANYAYLNPNSSFPVLHDPGQVTADTARISANGLGHPLLAPQVKVRNDFMLQNLQDIVLITGSNMAGKSTFLRTIGINLCMAYAGGPVDATRLEASLLRVFACIRINDSVTEGFSYFYSEVRRLRALLDALHTENKLPLLFLIDEIFKGTNNRERLIGSRAYIQALSTQKNGLGLVTTHDLELVKLEETIAHLANFHFREEVVGGKMVFDYTLRSGPCPTTNALKIMQMEGLPVDSDQQVL